MATALLKQARLARWDALFVALALTQGGLLLAFPSIPLIAIGLWWNANTISHIFIHRPFFRTPALNAAFSVYLSLLLGFPQSLWRARHLAHHGARASTGFRLAPLDSHLNARAVVGAAHLLSTLYDSRLLAGLSLWSGALLFAGALRARARDCESLRLAL